MMMSNKLIKISMGIVNVIFMCIFVVFLFTLIPHMLVGILFFGIYVISISFLTIFLVTECDDCLPDENKETVKPSDTTINHITIDSDKRTLINKFIDIMRGCTNCDK